jgi:hypothetical protein
MYQVLTYATHAYGKFEQLTKDPQVKVLGWGKPWKGFMDKFNGVLDYIKTVEDDTIIIFVDGFDSWVNGSSEKAVELFKQSGSGLIVSLDIHPRGSLLNKNIFGTCKDGFVANSGMYMGYAWCIREVLESIVVKTCKDDQVTLNEVCGKFDFLDIDTDKTIFENIPCGSEYHGNAIFVSEPGERSVIRVMRGVIDYTQFFINHILVLFLVLMFIKSNKIPIIFGLFSLTALVYMLYCDTSCQC